MDTHFENPWSTHCIKLGSHSIGQPDGSTFCFDLYALQPNNFTNPLSGDTIHFGARFSDLPSDYESGEAVYDSLNERWRINCGRHTSNAAAEYFANYYPL